MTIRVGNGRPLKKQRSVFPSDTALLKALYLATHEIAKKWTMPLRNWGRVLGKLEIMSCIPTGSAEPPAISLIPFRRTTAWFTLHSIRLIAEVS
ncbi:MAG: hypothetical protein J6F31_01295 [Oscillospiraceae bacterium]|nr:hypothetical protein [Oscillospiraceae bacterium]